MAERPGFTVDTHLFRELGELLVGRDSTALVELVKNAYDADAERVRLHAEGLDSERGRIEVADDGTGMDYDRFTGSFLRIAGRDKEVGDRRSPLYGRRYTGAKGIGRLAAHKLASRLVLLSCPAPHAYSKTDPEQLQGVFASIDWAAMEDDYETVDKVGAALLARRLPPGPARQGTVLRLRPLRTRWPGARQLQDFLEQVQSAVPPAALVDPPAPGLLSGPALLGTLQTRDAGEDDPGFRVELSGDLLPGDDLWTGIFSRMHWLLEIDASGPRVTYSIQPTSFNVKGHPYARGDTFRRDHPAPDDGPFFRARIYVREGSIGTRTDTLANFARRRGGVRVYLEGFRVVPYGDPGDDWLRLDRDYARKPRQFDIELDEEEQQWLRPNPREGYFTLGSASYYGAVVLLAERATKLRAVVNREGFVPNPAFDAMVDLVRTGIDLTTRLRADLERREKQLRRVTEEAELEEAIARATEQEAPLALTPGQAPPAPPPPPDVGRTLTYAAQQLASLRSDAALGAGSRAGVERVTAAVALASNRFDDVRDEQSTLRVLASVGTQLAAFVHEVNGLLAQAQTVRSLLGRLEETDDFSPQQRQLLRSLGRAVEELVASLTRQSSYLTDVVGPDARRRRRRLPLAEAADASLRLLAESLNARDVKVQVDLPRGVRTPPIFPAEMTIVMTNLLTNAIKAAGPGGRVRVTGGRHPKSGVLLRLENTGAAVGLADSERWFRPFQSTTTDVDVVLGQGMGLGLPITRRLAADYDGTVRFVEPSEGFATAVEVHLPEPGRGR